MSIDPADRAPRASRFATAQTALKKQEKDVKRARRRNTALWHQDDKRMTPASVIAAGAKPLRMLQEILDHADVIALDKPERGHTRKVHMLVTLPAYLLDRATALAAIDEDDEDTDGTESDQDKETGEDEESSIGACDGLVDQSKWGHEGGLPGDHVYAWSQNADFELDDAYAEPSLGSLGSSDANFDQDRWAAGDRLDRERGERGGDCDDDEENGDREPGEDDEPEHLEPNLSPCGPGVGSTQDYGVIDGECNGYGRDERDDAIRSRLKAHASMPVPIAGPPSPTSGVDIVPELWLPTGNRPGGLVEMKNQTTGETGVWKPLTRDGEAR